MCVLLSFFRCLLLPLFQLTAADEWCEDTHNLPPLFYLFLSLPLYHFHFVVSPWPGVLWICLMHHCLIVCVCLSVCVCVCVFVGRWLAWAAPCVCLLTDWFIHSCHMLYYPKRQMLECVCVCVCVCVCMWDGPAYSGWATTKKCWVKEFGITSG